MRLTNCFPLALIAILSLALPAAAHAQIPDDMIPLQTKLDELRLLRSSYEAAFNRHDAEAMADKFADDAVWVQSDGSVISGGPAIRAAMEARAPNLPHLEFHPDSTTVIGRIAFSEGMLSLHPISGPVTRQRYLAVVQRGMQEWKIVRLVAVPITE